jgi:predicted GNAT family acetyltransferase
MWCKSQISKKIFDSFIKSVFMTVQHKTDGRHGIFYVQDEDDIGAEMIYNATSKNQMIIEHTEVGETLRGNNIGMELVHAGVEYARHHGMKIIPLCPFAKTVLDKKVEWQDVLERNGG